MLALPDVTQLELDSWTVRNHYVHKYSWALPNEKAISVLAGLSPIVELGAGKGYWAALIQQQGGKVVPLDGNAGRHNPYVDGDLDYTKVYRGDHTTIPGIQAKTLFLCWPVQNSSAAIAVRNFAGKYVAYVGEMNGGCTADRTFHRLIRRYWKPSGFIEIPRWEGIHDALYIYRRRARWTRKRHR